MWPYDYFNQFSSIESDMRMGRRNETYLCTWYDGNVDTSPQYIKRQLLKRFIESDNFNLDLE